MILAVTGEDEKTEGEGGGLQAWGTLSAHKENETGVYGKVL